MCIYTYILENHVYHVCHVELAFFHIVDYRLHVKTVAYCIICQVLHMIDNIVCSILYILFYTLDVVSKNVIYVAYKYILFYIMLLILYITLYGLDNCIVHHTVYVL